MLSAAAYVKIGPVSGNQWTPAPYCGLMGSKIKTAGFCLFFFFHQRELNASCCSYIWNYPISKWHLHLPFSKSATWSSAVMKLGCKACMLSAALELKDEVAKPYRSVMRRRRRNSSSSSAAAEGRVPSRPGSVARDVIEGGNGKKNNSADQEEALRMVMFLSCWGPN